MFYSQFILAKKGPLGTIWIAAHLERKLRKNQVADTDIGVSVDSILFPDVPIALRLSSHLLLGVVRIYSRKVNYLFDDCSEALLKIKQAFRSTAVDLPPEESTAPYHSITLPETFDLDDFELPDSDIFQGNYVDHHISSREQITLQDTMDGVVYSTSQFGPDERFGDGDASGLDLDEELLLDKITAAGEAGLTLGSDDGLRASVRLPMTPGDANQMEGGDEDTEFAEYAQAPCTPGLMEEPNLSTVQETSACDDHMETDNHNNNTTSEFSVKDNLENASSKPELLIQQEKQNNPDTVPPEKNGYHSDDLESLQIKHQPLNDDNTAAADNDDMTSSHPKSPLTMDHQISLENNLNRVEVLVNGTTVTSEPSVEGIIVNEELLTETCQPPVLEVSLSENNNQEQSLATVQVSNAVEKAASLEDKPSEESNRESDDNKLGNGNLESEPCQLSKDSEVVTESSGPHFLSPCTTTCLNQSSPSNLPFEELSGVCPKDSSARDETTQVPGGVVVHTDISEQVLEENQNIRPPDSCEGADQFIGNDFPAPEKMLSVPEEGGTNIQNNFIEEEEATPAVMEFDRAGAVSESISGKKRSFTESTLTVQSLYSAESSGILHNKGTVESVPDDNDLLSSILVGRRSSVLKVKPTPTETKSMKRSRSAVRTSSYKRRVLMDDSMVLHGDTIRQQLTNTEDIRRVRKKAPCTRPEISMIQRQFLEDEIFSEPILTGESTELVSLHNQTFDLSEITVSHCDVNDASLEDSANPKLISLGEEVSVEAGNYTDMSRQLDITKETGINSSEPMMVIDEAPHVQFSDALIPAENEQYKNQILSSEMNICNTEPPKAKCRSPHENCLGENADVENNGKCLSDVAGVNPDGPVATFDRNGEIEASNILNEIGANEAAEKKDYDADTADVEKFGDNEAACVNYDAIAGPDKIDANEETVGGNGEEVAVVVENEYREKDEVEEIATTNQAMIEKEIRKNNQEQIVNEDDTILDAPVNEYNGNGIWDEQDSLNPIEGNMMDLRNTYLDYDGENPSQLVEAYPPLVTEAEVSANLNDDFDYSTAGHDTEFLNFDDDDEAEADGDGDVMPNAEETRFLENSGWSSRTRAVANYLQTLFEKEAERGRKVLPMDNLLSGKTRKEASRMFFEALVLKTKDYVHVEQKTPFNNINIYPRHNLLKSDF